MNVTRQGWQVEALQGLCPATLQRFIPVIFSAGLLFAAVTASAQFSGPDLTLARSVSGQFIINGSSQFSPLPYHRDVRADTNLIHLEPALLAVGAERFKASVWEALGLSAGANWRGKIFLSLTPARTANDDVVITSAAMSHAWEYHVGFPDVVARTRYARALSTVLLLEIANRNNPVNGHSLELPSWLVDGLAQVALDEDVAKVVLSAPTKVEKIAAPAGMENSIAISRVDKTQNGLDPLTSARTVLQSDTALTFDQISWPTDDQENGLDDDVYLASAQLFVHELLNLKNGPEKMRALLAQLPHCLNWQTAFYAAFRPDFQRPADVEKWWALRVVNFAAHNTGTQWTLASSSAQLVELLTVPVEIRSSSNSFPVHAQISLQDAIRRFTPEQRDEELQLKLRDLELAQFRVAPPFAALTSGYCVALADFLGDRRKIPRAAPRANGLPPLAAVHGGTSLDALKKQATAYQDANSIMAQYVAALKRNPQMGVVGQSKMSTQPQPLAQTKPVVIAKSAAAAPAKKSAARTTVTTLDNVNVAENNSPVSGRNPSTSVPMLKRASVKETLKKLDELDLHRRELLARLNLNFTPRNLASVAP